MCHLTGYGLGGEHLRFWSSRDVPTIFFGFWLGGGEKRIGPNCSKDGWRGLLKGLRMSVVWILKPVVLRIEEEAMSLLALCFCLLLSQFQPIFVSFVTIPAVPCHFFKPMALVGILPKKSLDSAIYWLNLCLPDNALVSLIHTHWIWVIRWIVLSNFGTTGGWRVISQSNNERAIDKVNPHIIALPYWQNTEACMGHERGAVEQKSWTLSQYLSQSFDVTYQSCNDLFSLIFRCPRLFVAPSLGR